MEKASKKHGHARQLLYEQSENLHRPTHVHVEKMRPEAVLVHVKLPLSISIQ